jgi:TetR/AcrR family transcriptional regulator
MSSKSSQSSPQRRVPVAGSARGRRSRAHAAQTRQRLLASALEAFSQVGFGAASLREIAERAGVSQQVITHHFETKLGLWKAAADHIFGRLGEVLGERMRGLEGVRLEERMRLLIHAFLGFCAAHPELARFMTLEGAVRGERLEWLVERHIRPLFEAVRTEIEQAQARGIAVAGDPMHLAYLFVGANTVFTQASEFALLTGRDVRDPAAVRAYAELVVRALLPGTVSEAPSTDVDTLPTRPAIPQEARRGAAEAAAGRRRGAFPPRR